MPVKKELMLMTPLREAQKSENKLWWERRAGHTGGRAGVPGKRHEGTFRGGNAVLIWVILVTPLYTYITMEAVHLKCLFLIMCKLFLGN